VYFVCIDKTCKDKSDPVNTDKKKSSQEAKKKKTNQKKDGLGGVAGWPIRVVLHLADFEISWWV
jgi:hypothetical protein